MRELFLPSVEVDSIFRVKYLSIIRLKKRRPCEFHLVCKIESRYLGRSQAHSPFTKVALTFLTLEDEAMGYTPRNYHPFSQKFERRVCEKCLIEIMGWLRAHLYLAALRNNKPSGR